MKQHTSKTRQELLDNTINHFTSLNRSSDIEGNCKYLSVNGCRCAIGLEIPKTKARIFDDLKNDNPVCRDEIFENLPKRLQKMGASFLSAIQRLHDTDEYWNKEGLSAKGLVEVEGIADMYELEVNYKKKLN